MRSTGTTDIREARVIRDRIMYEFFTIRDRLKPKPQGNCVDRVLKELRQVDQYVTQNVGIDFISANLRVVVLRLI